MTTKETQREILARTTAVTPDEVLRVAHRLADEVKRWAARVEKEVLEIDALWPELKALCHTEPDSPGHAWKLTRDAESVACMLQSSYQMYRSKAHELTVRLRWAQEAGFDVRGLRRLIAEGIRNAVKAEKQLAEFRVRARRDNEGLRGDIFSTVPPGPPC